MRCYANETMTCVDRYTGKYLQINGDPFQYAIYRNGTEDRLYLTVHWLQESTKTAVRDVLQCRAGGELYDFTDMAGWEDPVCVLPYLTDESDSGAVLYAFVPKGGYGVLYYNFVDYSIFPLYPGNYLTLPKISVSDVVMAGNYTQTVRWTLTPGDDRSGWAVHMELRYREPGEDSWETETLFTDTMENSWRMTTGSTIVGKEACLLLEYRTYRADWGGYNLDDFVTLNRTVTPWKLVERDAAIPLAPGNIGVSMLLAGGRVTVQWSAVKDPLNAIAAYRLERAWYKRDAFPVCSAVQRHLHPVPGHTAGGCRNRDLPDLHRKPSGHTVSLDRDRHPGDCAVQSVCKPRRYMGTCGRRMDRKQTCVANDKDKK